MKRIEEECKRRLFWCSYNLDKYLGAMLGRPCVFHDEDIDQVTEANIHNPCLSKSNTDHRSILQLPSTTPIWACLCQPKSPTAES